MKKTITRTSDVQYHSYFQEYFDLVEGGKIKACKEQFLLIALVKKVLARDDVYFDQKQAEDSVNKPAPYFPFELLPWQRFVNAVTFGIRYKEDDRPFFDRILMLVGRGAGKTGFAGYDSFYMSSGHHGVKNYDIDIVATSEDQAFRTFEDVYNVLEDPKNERLKKVFRYNRVTIQHLGTKSKIQYNTSNARTKDGKRSGCVYFDEVHEYEDYDNINVYMTGQGKVKDARIIFTTTDGKVRGGVLDDLKEESMMILNGEIENPTLFPFICRLDDDSEVDDPNMWEKAVPSLPYFPHLKRKMQTEYQQMQTNANLRMVFMTKRMNRPMTDMRREVASYEDRLATDQPLPDLSIRREAIGGLDFSDTRDFTAVGVMFKDKGKTYWIHHTFIHEIALKTQNIKREIIELSESKGLCTIVRNTPDIGHERVVNWFVEMAKKFYIKKISMDLYRASVVGPALKAAGFEIEIIRRGPATHAKLAPLIDHLFINRLIVFHDDPMMRWYVGNVYVDEKGNGNKEYLKIEKETRKTDGFFALTHALNLHEELKEPRKIRAFKPISL